MTDSDAVHRADGAPEFTLALSGGGFRATLFHLGVVRFLRDAGLLSRVRQIGAVSGGSILAAHLVLHWERYTSDEASFEAAARELLAFTRSDVRGRLVRRWILAWLLVLPRVLKPRHWTLTNLLQKAYERFYSRATLADLLPEDGRSRPNVHFFSASLSTGNACWFSPLGFTWIERNGNAEFMATSEIPVALAVAASSAFPPLFPPVAVSHTILNCDRQDFSKLQRLTDGGVYDNLGIAQLTADAPTADRRLIVSDAEGNFDWTEDSYALPLSRNVRASDLLMKRVSSLLYGFFSARQVGMRAVRISDVLGRNETAASPDIQRALRNLRTDLDAFSPAETHRLLEHGYNVARSRVGDLAVAETSTFVDPSASKASLSTGDLDEIAKGRERKLLLFAPRDWASWATAIVLTLYLAFFVVRPFVAQLQVDALQRTTEQLQRSFARDQIALSDLATSSLQRTLDPRATKDAKLLWVDDNPDNNTVVKAALEASGVLVKQVRSTDGAMAELDHQRFSVIVSDMSRLESSLRNDRAGYDLLKAVRAQLAEPPPIIFYTASSNAQFQVEAKRLGAFGETNLPSELLALIGQAIEAIASKHPSEASDIRTVRVEITRDEWTEFGPAQNGGGVMLFHDLIAPGGSLTVALADCAGNCDGFRLCAKGECFFPSVVPLSNQKTRIWARTYSGRPHSVVIDLSYQVRSGHDVPAELTPFETVGDYVAIGCAERREATVVFVLPKGASEVTAICNWVDVDKIRPEECHTRISPSAVEASGIINGLDRDWIGNCPGGGHARLRLSGSFKQLLSFSAPASP